MDGSHNSRVKAEPSSPTRPRRQRLRSPVIISDSNANVPIKRSRLSSPVIIKDENPDESRRDVTESKAKAETVSPHSRKLAEDTNLFKGVLIKYNEPEDARKPTVFWRMYPFKGNESLPVLHIHRQSGYLIGRDRNIADIPMDHPSISKQHAVLQFRYTKGQTRLYVIDLESANGTFLNNKKIEPRRYYEVQETDVIKFGFSSRDYVVMTDKMENTE
ncbi:unnamed protein product [Dibothriocephalus latus]|uniref:FHA domain-containing protein n=1 Tax=Dibothriocephalus latus TaxID=60516 RepID=A0A3P7LB23_DIBLA|nr:unnamed protein product [Dibothriocephalus latus]